MRTARITGGLVCRLHQSLVGYAVLALLLSGWTGVAAAHCRLPILVYHRFAAKATDSMTVRTNHFAAQLDYLAGHGYTVVPLRQAVACLRGEAVALPPKALAITVDDGHRSVYTDMLPLVRRQRIPVTLFIYPSAISNASYALTWEQLAELRASGLFEVQSHTYWHPNFKQEQRRLTPEQYQALVRMQLEKSRSVIAAHLGTPVDLLAWPFGIHDADLIARAAAAGYRAAFTLDRRSASDTDDPMALPRYLMVDALDLAGFARLLQAGSGS